MHNETLRRLPSVDRLLAQAAGGELVAGYGRVLALDALRASLAEARAAIRAGGPAPAPEALLRAARAQLEALAGRGPQRVINATGVIVHTNLGRAPLSRAAQAASAAAAQGYSSLEYDLESGARGGRGTHVTGLLARLAGAEAALVVNNNAAAVLLALAALARGRKVIISRGQLVEIGGGFRVPDVLKESGARLVEVGTTNRTHLQDYERAIDGETALLLRAHHSNFKMIGFALEPPPGPLAVLAERHGLWLVDDLGSGALRDTAQYGLAHEPTVQDSLAAGAALVCFSGDKLLGGPQAGLIVGRKALVERLAGHPLARAVRADKLCLAALGATLLHYARGEAEREIPIWQMIARPAETLAAQARAWVAAWRQAGAPAETLPGESTVGGGSLPGETLPTTLAALRLPHPDRFAAALRAAPTPIIARIAAERVVFDPRTVLEEEAELLVTSVSDLLGRR